MWSRLPVLIVEKAQPFSSCFPTKKSRVVGPVIILTYPCMMHGTVDWMNFQLVVRCRWFGSKESTSSVDDCFWRLPQHPDRSTSWALLAYTANPFHNRQLPTAMPSKSVLPAPYFYFFWLLEPILTVVGGVSAIYDPISFGGNTIPRNIERATVKMGSTVRGQIVVSELGSCKSCSNILLQLNREKTDFWQMYMGCHRGIQVSCCWQWFLSRSSISSRNTSKTNLCFKKSWWRVCSSLLPSPM